MPCVFVRVSNSIHSQHFVMLHKSIAPTKPHQGIKRDYYVIWFCRKGEWYVSKWIISQLIVIEICCDGIIRSSWRQRFQTGHFFYRVKFIYVHMGTGQDKSSINNQYWNVLIWFDRIIRMNYKRQSWWDDSMQKQTKCHGCHCYTNVEILAFDDNDVIYERRYISLLFIIVLYVCVWWIKEVQILKC